MLELEDQELSIIGLDTCIEEQDEELIAFVDEIPSSPLPSLSSSSLLSTPLIFPEWGNKECKDEALNSDDPVVTNSQPSLQQIIDYKKWTSHNQLLKSITIFCSHINSVIVVNSDRSKGIFRIACCRKGFFLKRKN